MSPRAREVGAGPGMLAAKDPALPPRLCLPACHLVLGALHILSSGTTPHMAFTTIAGLRLEGKDCTSCPGS